MAFRSGNGVAYRHDCDTELAFLPGGVVEMLACSRATTSGSCSRRYGKGSMIEARLWSGGAHNPKVDSVVDGNQKLGGAGVRVVQGAHLEPWGQQTCRFLSASGQLCEISETPWSRTLKASVRVSATG